MESDLGNRGRRLSLRRSATIAGAALMVGAASVGVLVLKDDSADASGVEEALSIERGVARERIEELAIEARPEQAEALTDRRVDLSEYRAAVAASIQCLQSGLGNIESPAGVPESKPQVTTHGPEVSDDGFQVTYSYTLDTSAMNISAPDPSSFDPISDLERACQERFQWGVETAYQIGRLADQEYVASVAESFEACAKSAGLPTLGSDEHEVVETIKASSGNSDVLECLDRTPSVASALASADGQGGGVAG
jgi:hypothetical protein